jgi:hypothetical protein
MLTTFAAVVRTVRRLVLPRVVPFVDDYRFIFPAIAWTITPSTPGVAGAALRIAVGWWRWHVEFIWQNTTLSETRRD